MMEAERTEHLNQEQQRDYTGSKMGMWLFLYTEFLLFGGLFLLYSVYRTRYVEQFHTAAATLDTVLGAVNTVVLITSSLTMAVSVSAIRKGDRKLSVSALFLTILFGCGFLVIKFFEWKAKIAHGLFPGALEMFELPQGEVIFYSLYYVITGMHGLHVLVGVVVLLGMLTLLMRKKINEKDFIKLENTGLYWHLVDIVWIYLFPFFYLLT
ncbi:MAG: cytochrome c oxidase subunit 3 [Nitrospiraceae bacterium]|nr:MAG: cytochrome c oxidase subunit 3 [Nitrospiraceae bacterium]